MKAKDSSCLLDNRRSNSLSHKSTVPNEVLQSDRFRAFFKTQKNRCEYEKQRHCVYRKAFKKRQGTAATTFAAQCEGL